MSSSDGSNSTAQPIDGGTNASSRPEPVRVHLQQGYPDRQIAEHVIDIAIPQTHPHGRVPGAERIILVYQEPRDFPGSNMGFIRPPPLPAIPRLPVPSFEERLALPEVFTAQHMQDLRRLQARVRTMWAQYRESGLRFYNLSSLARIVLVDEGDADIRHTYEVHENTPEPPVATALNEISSLLDEAMFQARHGRGDEALRIMHGQVESLREIRHIQGIVEAAIFQATQRFNRDLYSELQQARSGVVPHRLLQWCRCLREVKLALQQGAIEDDAHEILLFVVDDEDQVLIVHQSDHSAADADEMSVERIERVSEEEQPQT